MHFLPSQRHARAGGRDRQAQGDRRSTRVKARKNLDDILTFFKSNAPRMMLGDPAVGGEALTAGYAQMALAADGHPLDRVTATMTHWVLARQMPDGRWLGNGLNRPPSEYSCISHTAIAAGGLSVVSAPRPSEAKSRRACGGRGSGCSRQSRSRRKNAGCA